MPSDAAEADAKIQILKDALYDEARQHGSADRLFTQKDLLDLNVIPSNDVVLLLRVVQSLTDDKLFVGATNHAGLAWRWRSREDAQKYTSLPNDETMMVYSIVDEAGADGVWNRHIKHRLGMHEAVVKSCIKYLETKGYIVAMKNVEHPHKKMYIRANLRPSDRATGGPWFTDGELDSPFITELETIVFEYIKNHSAYLGSLPIRGGGGATGADGALKAPRKGIIRGGAAANGDARGLKRAATEISNDEQPAAATGAPAAASSEAAEAKNSSSAASRAARGKVFLPFPAGYKSYPIVTEIAQFIHKTGITNNTTLGEADIQQLVDVLVYDGLVEAVKVGGRKGYRVMRAAKQDTASFEKRQKEREEGIGLDKPHTGVALPTNGVTEAPCGRCPVFEICEEGGPVSPSKCVYFMQWLGLEDRGGPAGGAPAMVSL